FSIGLSMESLKKETFESIRLFGNMDRFLENMTFFKNYCLRKNTYFNLSVTPLKNTIFELSDFVKFANKEGIMLYFNVATEPHHLALWTLSPNELNNIIQFYDNITLPTNNPIEKYNYNQFYSYLNQIKIWQEESKEREEKIH